MKDVMYATQCQEETTPIHNKEVEYFSFQRWHEGASMVKPHRHIPPKNDKPKTIERVRHIGSRSQLNYRPPGETLRGAQTIKNIPCTTPHLTLQTLFKQA